MIRKIGFCLVLIGQLFMIAAMCIVAYNIWDEVQTKDYTLTVAECVEEMIDNAAEEAAEEIPAYVLNPEMEMPEKEIDGCMYVGKLEIPAYELNLPVISQWSYPKLRMAPCRYEGSAYLDNLIISAHNYNSHFGNLKNLQMGDLIVFTDMDGNVFEYRVAERETLMPTAIEEMKSGDWDLTLFTCTLGGQYRVTVRCERIKE